MICKNCSAQISDSAKVCPNCGAFVDDSSGYTLLSSDDRYDDVYSGTKKKRNKLSPFQNFLIFVLVIAIAAAGSFLYFDKIRPAVNKAPEVSFTSGSGIINRDEKVIYIIPDSKEKSIEYIQGVSLYDYDKNNKKDGKKPVTYDYEYTKNVDSTFRAIYCDVGEYDIKSGKNYTYTFEVKLSFRGSDKIYTYFKTVDFSGSFNDDISDVIFDNSIENSVE